MVQLKQLVIMAILSLVSSLTKMIHQEYPEVLKNVWNQLINEDNGKIVFKEDDIDNEIYGMLLHNSLFTSYIKYILNHLKLKTYHYFCHTTDP
jgi:hypothetical protein